MDLGDGFKAMYVNLTLTGEPIRHRYESPGVYRVSVRAENVAGHDEAVLFVQVTGEPIAPAWSRATPCGRDLSLRKHREPGAGRQAGGAGGHTHGALCNSGAGGGDGGGE